MMLGINITRDISKFIVSHFTRLMARKITYNIFEISLVVFTPNITTNDAITYTNTHVQIDRSIFAPYGRMPLIIFASLGICMR